MERSRYHGLVEKLIHLSHTQLDKTYVIGIINQFMHQSKETHFLVVNKILKYLKFTPRKKIIYRKNREISLDAYIIANWVGSVIKISSTLGYCALQEGNLVI